MSPESGHQSAGAWDAAMRRGDWETALAINDAVLRARDPAGRDDPNLPYHRRWVWDGRDVAGRRVLVRCYHGLGDVIHFARYLRPLAARAADVLVEAPPALVPLLARIDVIRVVAFDMRAPHPPRDVDIEIMELGHVLRIKAEHLADPYLAPDVAPDVARASLTPADAAAIGYCWRAGDWDPARSLSDDAASCIRGARRRFVSLQAGEGDCPAELAQTAARVAGVTSVVTVDTMIAHLAGAIGRPGLLLLRAGADWRWGDDPTRCALYPSLVLLRQRVEGDWSEPAARARALLDRDS